MRAVIQRVTRASVKVDAGIVGQIEKGLLVLLGVAQDDTEADADYLADKIVGMRVFEDADEKMNLAVNGSRRRDSRGLPIHFVWRHASRSASVV